MTHPLTAPLLNKDPAEPICLLSNADYTGYQEISSALFLAQAYQLAESMPSEKYVLNLCGNRYHFMLGFCASLINAQTTLLPPNRHIETQVQLVSDYSSFYVLHDGSEVASHFTKFDIRTADLMAVAVDGENFDIPNIALDHVAAIAFTSGSTGDSKPNIKTWEALYHGAAMNKAFFLGDSEYVQYQLATVPAQHMWGFETSVLMPMQAKACVVSDTPLFPKDIQRCLQHMPVPKMLISAPIHLRAIEQSGLEYVPVARTLCATAPLSKVLAEGIEKTLQTNLHEVYGCSEVGSMAARRTTEESRWRWFDGLEVQVESLKATVSIGYLPTPIELQDFIKPAGEQYFSLQGRESDLVKIAGKRTSLLTVNHHLMEIEGVRDGIVFFPPQDKTVPRLVALVVVANKMSKQKVREALRQQIDPVFLPRPIFIVEALPREKNGKLPLKKVIAMYNELLDL